MSGPVLAFDINATRGGVIRRISTETQIEDPVAAPVADELAAPAGVTENKFNHRAVSRADLAATYAGLLGVDIVRMDVLERLAEVEGEKITLSDIAVALKEVGLVC